MAAQTGNAQRARLFRKIGFGFFIALIAWSIVAASIGVYRALTSGDPVMDATIEANETP